MLLAAVVPVLLTVQLMVAAVGVAVGVVLVQAVNVSAGGVGRELTTRLTAVEVAAPVLAATLSVPL